MKELFICDEGRPPKVLPICRKHNCGIEIQAFSHPSFLKNFPDGIKLHLKGLGDIKPRSLHGPFFELCPGSKDELIREVTMKRYQEAYDIALKLNAEHIVLHHGYVPRTNSYDGWLKRTVEFWKEFTAGKSVDVNFYLENVLELDPSLLSDVIEGIGFKRVKVCLDIGHAHCNSKTSVIEWIESLKGKIGYVHLHDNHQETDEHLGLGEGNIPLEEVCRALEEYSPDAIWAIETSIDTKEKSILWLKESKFM